MRLATALFAVLLGILVAAPAAKADSYKVDPVHSALLFRIGHLGVSNTHGRFNGPSGSVNWDSADPAKSSFEVTVPAGNVDTGNAKRDEHLRGPDFFDAKQFDTLSFKSTSVKKVDDKHYDVSGDLTIRGVSKPVTLKLEMIGAGKSPMGDERAGFEGVFTINRLDYGVSYMPEAIGTDVQITVALELIKQ